MLEKENLKINNLDLNQVNYLIGITEKEIEELKKEIKDKSEYLLELINYLEN